MTIRKIKSIAMSLVVFSAVQAQASLVKVEEGDDQYIRPGTGYVVKANGGVSKVVNELYKKYESTLSAHATLTAMNNFFTNPCSAFGFVLDVFNLYDKAGKNLTVAADAMKLLPENTVLAVHKFERTLTQEGLPAIATQNSKSQNGVPISYEAVVKHIDDKESGDKTLYTAYFDLTGGTKPLISVKKIGSSKEKTPKEEEIDNEFEMIQPGETTINVAIYGKNLPMDGKYEGTAVRRQFVIKDKDI